MAFGPPGCRRLARPAPEGRVKALAGIAEGGCDLSKRDLGILQQLTRDLEADLVRDRPVAPAAAFKRRLRCAGAS